MRAAKDITHHVLVQGGYIGGTGPQTLGVFYTLRRRSFGHQYTAVLSRIDYRREGFKSSHTATVRRAPPISGFLGVFQRSP